jgi:hypothetical protein
LNFTRIHAVTVGEEMTAEPRKQIARTVVRHHDTVPRNLRRLGPAFVVDRERRSVGFAHHAQSDRVVVDRGGLDPHAALARSLSTSAESSLRSTESSTLSSSTSIWSRMWRVPYPAVDAARQHIMPATWDTQCRLDRSITRHRL